MAWMIYHVPYPLEFTNPTGGGVRPVKMLRAFESTHQVMVVQGNAAERRTAMKRVFTAIQDGVEFDFCYSESSTMPTALTQKHHLPTHPLLDMGFFSSLRRAGVPVGVFYRDIHWRFPMYRQSTTLPKRLVARAFYRFDLVAYGRCVDHLFLPSVEMAAQVPLPRRVPISALPPGHDIDAEPSEMAPHPVKLFYVGGTRQNYRMAEFLGAVRDVPETSFTLCTREVEWQEARTEYAPLLGDNLTVVHANGPGTRPFFEQANIGVVATQPQEYWTFAAPLKVYEYLGHGLPIIASEGSLAGRFVAENQVGWTVPYRREAFVKLLRDLDAHPEKITEARERVLCLRNQHSWTGRAHEVAQVMAEYARPPASSSRPTTTS